MEMTPENVELAFLSSLTTAAAVRGAQAAGIDSMSFQVESHEKVWLYLAARAEQDRDITHADVLAVCNVQLTVNVTDIDTLLTQLVQLSVARRAMQSIMKHVTPLETDAVATVGEMVTELQALLIAERTHETHFEDIDSRVERVLALAAQAAEEGYIGIPTGLGFFDEQGDTWKPGEMSAIVGATNAGKSWLLLFFAAVAYFRHQKRVLFLSPENSIADIEARLDVIVANEMGIELSNRALRSGRVDAEAYHRYAAAFKERVGEDQMWITRDAGSRGVFSVNDIVALTREHKPDMLCVDGFHLVQGPGDKSWERMKEAAEQLKGLAQDMGIVILTVSQAQREAVLAPDDAPEIGQIAYGMALGEACNRILSMAEKRGSAHQRVIKLIKNRDGEKLNKRFYLKFDVDKGDIGQQGERMDDDGLIEF